LDRFVSIALAGCLFTMLSFFSTTGHAENVMLVGWDGAGLRHVQPMLANGELPNLSALLASGGHMVPLELLARTQTIPSWTQVFTGLTYDQTGVLGNNPKVLGGRMSTATIDGVLMPGLNFWLMVIPYNDTIIPAIQQQGYRIGWFVSKAYLGNSKKQSPLALIGQNAERSIVSDEGARYSRGPLSKSTRRGNRNVRNFQPAFFCLRTP
jgi:hypothetical protein